MTSLAEKIAAVEFMIYARMRDARDPRHRHHLTWKALKQVAKDLRAQEPDAVSAAFLELERRIMAIQKNGSTPERVNQLAHELMARWPAIRRALLAEKEKNDGASVPPDDPARSEMPGGAPADRRNVAG